MSQAVVLNEYVFNKTAQTIVFPDYESIKLEGIKLITNVTTGTIIYQFNASTKLGTVSGKTLTLAYDTSAMADTDKLMIIYDPPSGGFFDRVTSLMQMIMQFVKSPDYAISTALGKKIMCILGTDSSIGTITTVTTVSTVTNLTTAATLTNLTNFNTLDSRYLVWGAWQQNYNEGIRSKIT